MALRAIPSNSIEVKILTVARNLPADFGVELVAFRKQYPRISIMMRGTADFS